MKIAEKIKKLLRLSKSPNPAEAALALQRAMDLAAKYRIDVESLDLDDDLREIAHEWFRVGARLSRERRLAINLVINYFNVDACISLPRVVFVGAPQDIAIATYVMDFLIRAERSCRKSWTEWERAARRKITPGKRANFTHGFFYGVRDQLSDTRQEQLEDSRFALILASESTARESYMDDLIPERQSRKDKKLRQSRSSLMAGFLAGRNTQISKPLGASQAEQLRLE